MMCADDIGKHEHKFHSRMEQLGIEIAKKEAKLENLNAIEKNHERLINSKECEIERLNEIVLELSKNKYNVNIEK